ncbi:hypothetical protein Kpho02_76610 [Kitasatospora phosalacinea]|uniref:Uncharacterized protein n=1 Tax=Kitasatospora phosalacinea TaxID=2065 RepID=A0A9W6V4C5_9ACTN|nr:hypothetical protein [Kitasatospora phosalacinea]GLW75364.1 hypothetical protein Kpho02_76610 [Kitasatospora phosalacinea]
MHARVMRSDFRRLTPIREPRALSEVPQRVWEPGEWERIQRGFRARAMEDRWHIFAEGDRLFLHRSWRGDGRYEATFVEAQGGHQISRVLVEDAEPRFPGGSDHEVCLLLEILINSILLGEQTEEQRRRLSDLRSAG